MRVLRALGGTVVVLLAAAGVFVFGLVAQTGVDLSITSNLIVFWAFNGIVAAGALFGIARVWAKVFELGPFGK